MVVVREREGKKEEEGDRGTMDASMDAPNLSTTDVRYPLSIVVLATDFKISPVSKSSGITDMLCAACKPNQISSVSNKVHKPRRAQQQAMERCIRVGSDTRVCIIVEGDIDARANIP